jgi:hypothetical protein
MNKPTMTALLFSAVIFISYAQDITPTLITPTFITPTFITPTGGIKVSVFQGSYTQERYDGYLIHTNFTPKNMVKIDMKLGAYIGDNLLIIGRIETYTIKNMDNPYFAPYQSDYFIGASYQAGPIVIGVEHGCYHPVISGLKEVQRTGGYNSLYAEWEF